MGQGVGSMWKFIYLFGFFLQYHLAILSIIDLYCNKKIHLSSQGLCIHPHTLHLSVGLTQDGDAHLQTAAPCHVGRGAGVQTRVPRLGENEMQRSRAEDALAYRLGQRLPVFVPADRRDGVSLGLALQGH